MTFPFLSLPSEALPEIQRIGTLSGLEPHEALQMIDNDAARQDDLNTTARRHRSA
jgi:hypothetical protein